MKQSVYKLTLKIDNIEFFAVKFEELDFETQRTVNFRYEYLHAVNNEKRVQRLYNASGNDFSGSSSKNKSNGIVGSGKNLTYGHHKGEIIAEDAFGNKQSLLFDFIYGPQKELYQLDSQFVEMRKDDYFYFTPSIELDAMQIDSVIPYINRGALWGKAKGATIETMANGQILCRLKGLNTSTTTVRLFLFSKNSIIRDNIFCGVIARGKPNVQLQYDILEDGILINLEVHALHSADARIELYYKEH